VIPQRQLLWDFGLHSRPDRSPCSLRTDWGRLCRCYLEPRGRETDDEKSAASAAALLCLLGAVCNSVKIRTALPVWFHCWLALVQMLSDDAAQPLIARRANDPPPATFFEAAPRCAESPPHSRKPQRDWPLSVARIKPVRRRKHTAANSRARGIFVSGSNAGSPANGWASVLGLVRKFPKLNTYSFVAALNSLKDKSLRR
jgi:hypothetical protein